MNNNLKNLLETMTKGFALDAGKGKLTKNTRLTLEILADLGLVSRNINAYGIVRTYYSSDEQKDRIRNFLKYEEQESES